MAEGVTVANAFVQIMPSMEGATDNITSAILPGIGKAGDKAGSMFSGMFAGKMGAMLKGLGAAAIGYMGLSTMASAFSDVENGFNNIIKATGATGESAESLKRAYLDVAGSVVGSFDDIGSALGELNTMFGVEGDALVQLTEQTMKYAKVTGTDATTAAHSIAQMMNNAGISTDDYGKVLDELTAAGQASGISVDKLAQSVNANATTMKEMGFNTEDTIAMLSQFEKTGADTSTILAAMKKGVQNWTKEGKSAQEGFADFVKGVQDGSVDSQKAIEIFGAKGGLAMFDAAQKGQLSFESMYDAIVNNSGDALNTVYQDTLTAQEKFDMLGQNITKGFYEIAEPIVDAIAPYMDDIISTISSAIRWFTNNAVPLIKGFIDVIGTLISGLVDTAVKFKQAAEQAFEFASGVASDISTAVQNIISWWGSLPERIGGFMSEVSEKVTSTFNGIVDFVLGIPDRIVSFFSGLGSAITNAIGSIHFPTPHISWESLEIFGMSTPINLPHIAWYAQGGIIDAPTLIGAGEAGREAVIPLTEPNIAPFADAVANRIGTGNITINEMTVVTDSPEDFMRQLTAFAAQTRRQYA